LILDPSGILSFADSQNDVIRSVALPESATFAFSATGFASTETSGSSIQISTGFASITPYESSAGFSGMAILGLRSKNVLGSKATVTAGPAIRSGRIPALAGGP
jgi:hypothetical protein